MTAGTNSWPSASKLRIVLCVFMAWACTGLGEQKQTSCAINIPMNVVAHDGKLLRGLSADQFTTESRHKGSKILRVRDDSRPRRILLLVETGPRVSQKIRNVEADVLRDMLSEARPIDFFALRTVGQPQIKITFGESHNEILAGANELGPQHSKSERIEGVLDALLDATAWFREPTPGDAVFLMTLGFGDEHKATYRAVEKELASRHVRLFSLQFAPVVAGGFTGGLVQLTPRGYDVLASPAAFLNREDVGNMSWNSGGYMVAENIVGDAQNDPEVSAEKLEGIKIAASRMQSAIADMYRVDLEASPGQLKLSLASDLQKKVPNATLIYPRYEVLCQ